MKQLRTPTFKEVGRRVGGSGKDYETTKGGKIRNPVPVAH
jgi:hypothetical protein